MTGLTLGDLTDPTDGYRRDLPLRVRTPDGLKPVRSVGIGMAPTGPDQVGLVVIITPEES